MRNYYSIIGIWLFIIGFFAIPATLYAQDAPEAVLAQTPEQTEALRAVAGKDRNIKVGQTVVFDGSGSFNPIDSPLKYEWDFGDGRKAYGPEVTYIYRQPGVFTVTLKIDNGTSTTEDTLVVQVDQNIVLLIADHSVSQERLDEVKEKGKEKGVLFVVVKLPRSESSHIAEEELTNRLLLVQDDLQKADLVIVWTKPGIGLDALVGLGQRLHEREAALTLAQLGFPNKVIINITDHSFWILERLGESVFDLVQPQMVLLARENIIDRVLEHPRVDEFVTNLTSSGEEYRGIRSPGSLKQITYSNPLFLLEHYLLKRGVPLNTLSLIVFLPVIAALVAFARTVLGVKSFGIFVPTIISLSLIATGLKYGLSIFILVLVVATVARYLFRRLRFLYLARISLVLTVVSLSIIGMLFVGALFDRTGFLTISIFPVLVMVTLVENFVSVQIDKGLGVATRITIETILLAVVGYYLANWGLFRVLVFGYPMFVFLIIFIITIILGRFVGLRVGEYLRFRQVMKYVESTKEK